MKPGHRKSCTLCCSTCRRMQGASFGKVKRRLLRLSGIKREKTRRSANIAARTGESDMEFMVPELKKERGSS